MIASPPPLLLAHLILLLTAPPSQSSSCLAFSAESTTTTRRRRPGPRPSPSSSSSSTSLRSLRPLVEEIASMIAASRAAAADSDDDNDNDNTPVIFVGGKGGVGKTTVSSALAVELASSHSPERDDWNVLVVSTDPAHSLGDALDVDLRRGTTSATRGGGAGRQGQQGPTTLSDPITNRRLHALEVDPRAALDNFREDLSRLFDSSSDFELGGVSIGGMLEEMGLGADEIENLLRDPPPGLDEYVALANVLDPKFAADDDYDDRRDGNAGAKRKYDVIVVDTAPTGHTLRMLQLPQFLDGFLGTILALRGRLRGLAGTLRMIGGVGGGGGVGVGGGGKSDGSTAATTVDDALVSIENFRRRASSLRDRLGDTTRTKFVVVTIPTILGARESERLMTELVEQNMCVSDVVVNQCVAGGGHGLEAEGGGVVVGGGGGETVVANDSIRRYYDRRVSGQRRWISELAEACREVSSSEEYRGNSRDDDGGGTDIAVTEVPFYDMELVGVPALGFLGSQTFFGVGEAINGFERLVGSDDRDAVDGARDNPRVVICGGKGGVGKTTTSSSLAIAMALSGHDVALVSTDPAHSLGDALDMNLGGGSLVDVPLYGVMRPPSMTAAEEGSLKAMEIDPASALGEFRDSIDKLLGKNNDGGNPSELSSALGSLGEIIDTLPAGADEVVALAKVIQLIRRGKFDRVVLDTAPTGHTLRMLTTPSFLADLIERVLSVAAKLNSNVAVKLLLSSAIGQNRAQVDDAYESAKSALLKFQVSMYDLEDMFADPDSTEFLIVTIASELAVRESVRLLNDLTFGDPDMPIRVRNVVVNQVLDSSDEGEGDAKDERLRGFIERLTASQSSSIREICRAVDGMNEPPRVTKVAMLDVEPRGVYGLKAMSEQLLQSSIKAEEFAS